MVGSNINQSKNYHDTDITFTTLQYKDEVNRVSRIARGVTGRSLSVSLYVCVRSWLVPRMSEHDQVLVKNALMDALLNEHETSVRDLLAETLHHISMHDYPLKWPDLLPTLLNVIQSSEALRVHNALLALRKICKRYEYKAKEHRGPLNEVVRQSFGLLLPLAKRLSAENSLEAALMLKQILKIFWSSTQFYLPQHVVAVLSLATPSRGRGDAKRDCVGVGRDEW